MMHSASILVLVTIGTLLCCLPASDGGVVKPVRGGPHRGGGHRKDCPSGNCGTHGGGVAVVDPVAAVEPVAVIEPVMIIEPVDILEPVGVVVGPGYIDYDCYDDYMY